MKQSQLAAYSRVHARLLAAQQELAEASAEMQAMSPPIAGEIDAVMAAHQRSIVDADAAVGAAQRRLAVVEIEVGITARKRYVDAGGIGLVFLLDDEQARVDAARAAVEDAKHAAVEARDRHKAGVTPEQLEASIGVEADPDVPAVEPE